MSNELHNGGVSIVVPAYNEQESLPETVRSLCDSLWASNVSSYSLIIVNDGSTDKTPRIADDLAAGNTRIKALHQSNKGIGGALQAGFTAAEYPYTLIWPADMHCTVDDLIPFISAAGKADVVVGCRKQRVAYNTVMRFNAWLYPLLVRLLFGLKLKDVNWICMYRTHLLRNIEITQNGIPMLTEILVRIRDEGGTFREVDVAMKPRKTGTPSAARFRVMWRTAVGLLRFWRIWMTRLRRRN